MVPVVSQSCSLLPWDHWRLEIIQSRNNEIQHRQKLEQEKSSLEKEMISLKAAARMSARQQEDVASIEKEKEVAVQERDYGKDLCDNNESIHIPSLAERERMAPDAKALVKVMESKKVTHLKIRCHDGARLYQGRFLEQHFIQPVRRFKFCARSWPRGCTRRHRHHPLKSGDRVRLEERDLDFELEIKTKFLAELTL